MIFWLPTNNCVSTNNNSIKLIDDLIVEYDSPLLTDSRCDCICSRNFNDNSDSFFFYSRLYFRTIAKAPSQFGLVNTVLQCDACGNFAGVQLNTKQRSVQICGSYVSIERENTNESFTYQMSLESYRTHHLLLILYTADDYFEFLKNIMLFGKTHMN